LIAARRAFLLGLAGGAAGAALGHVAVVAGFRLTGDASIWFKGPHGPPFFSLVVNTSVFYACLGGALAERGVHRRAAALSFAAGFVPIWLPMATASRVFTWGEGPAAEPTWAWVYLILACYALACSLGTWTSGASGFRPLRRSAGWGAAFGGLAAYVLGLPLARFVPALRGDYVNLGFLPSFGAVFNGATAGALVGAGSRFSAKRRDP